MKKIKNRQKWRCQRPKYSLGGPGRPPQPEFASKITARRVNFSGSAQPKLRFDVFCLVFLFRFLSSFFENMALFFGVLENIVMMIVVRKERQKARRKARQSLYTS